MTKPMFHFYFSISLAIASSALYHFTASLLVTYAVAFFVTLLGFFFFPAKHGVIAEIKQINWAPAPAILFQANFLHQSWHLKLR